MLELALAALIVISQARIREGRTYSKSRRLFQRKLYTLKTKVLFTLYRHSMNTYPTCDSPLSRSAATRGAASMRY